jgi:NADPH2:quinone reductase
MRITDGKGVDLILEMLANVNLAKDLTVLARNGRVIVIGNRGTIEINPRDLMSREASIIGMTMMNTTPDELATIHTALGAGLRNGTLNPLIGKRYPLADAARAHHDIIENTAFGKLLLIP